ncbi:uncharacterized protein B0H18DRAFT_312000 [Fomitopsis serialis]|uniref:uncharacterized protein n=1 Tax=Fomitopsis serialis TaxID=139415 RepID=UPI002007FB5D|nr:uncharacterized protein B0H18DRAFT_312000 [Neoantrodia serialis]KAH9936086.1 hypothetical protein B0H18DRAFT_312000 [Neoantrodia serialis]
MLGVMLRGASPGAAGSFRTREALDDCVYMLMSNGNRPYGKHFDDLQIWENSHRRRKPFTHIWPMRIPGHVLPRLRTLGLYGLDWTATRPHYLFFHFLSYYTSITVLSVGLCRFRSMAELRRICNALPSLEQLSLSDITVQHPLMPDLTSRHIPWSRNKLKTIELTIVASIFEPVAHLHEHCQSLLDMCITYSYVTMLTLDLRYFSSFSHLHQFLCHFPHLSRLSLHEAFGSHVEPASVADIALYTAHASNPSLSFFQLYHVPGSWASQILLPRVVHVRILGHALRRFFVSQELHSRRSSAILLMEAQSAISYRDLQQTHH